MAVAAAASPAVVSAAIDTGVKYGTELGRQVFVYNNIRTKQIAYSLTRSLQNTKALKQLPFLGRNTKPPTIRKDHWKPLCVLSFPNQLQGFNAYQKLREFKVRHETEWPVEDLTQKEGKFKGQLVGKKEKGRILMDQKANSIADMAAVLAIQARPPTEAELEKADRMVNGPAQLRGRPKPKRGLGSHQMAEAYEFRGKMDGVSIWWANTLDAEYAETWPKEVEHGKLAVNRSTAVWPPSEPEEIQETDINDGVTDDGSGQRIPERGEQV